jgi:ATP-dependent Clp protease, protease subunit
MSKVDLKKEVPIRNLYLFEVVKETSVNPIIKDIINFNQEDDEREKEFRDFNRKDNPIYLNISSFGGSVYCGLGLYDVIISSKTPIYTIATGKAMSMGFMLLLAGHKRFARKNATMMYHEIASFAWDKLEGLKQEVAECSRLQEEIIDKIVLEKTNITKQKITEVRSARKDWFIDSLEAKKLGIIHEIL